jgi:hypothetical protein
MNYSVLFTKNVLIINRKDIFNRNSYSLLHIWKPEKLNKRITENLLTKL